ncbi:MAG: UDP-3-O-acyl-N-acetylglucosamine deacetylase, partial [Prolixibacteraceae bacterium]|nr:UDP-3-O-acyl-N-acetylglucosamine deacetylase [Prolixibacteraceae bacterium]
MTNQKTLAKPFTLKGKGLHTGRLVTMTFLPAPENYGFKFKRIDLEGEPIIEADADLVAETSRGTLLEKNGVKIGTIEHVLAALAGMDLDNVLMEVDNEEAPILDGSSKYFVEEIEKAGIVEQEAEREYFIVEKKITFKDEKTGSELIALPDDDYSLNVMISFDSNVLKNQFATLNSIGQFKNEISACRTFVFLHELEFLLNHNLIKGGDLDNAIVIVDREMEQENVDKLAKLFNHKKVEIKSQEILNNIDLYFDNECARHKLLDVIGDLALCGKHIKGRIIATKPGHTANTVFAKILKKAIKKKEREAPAYDVNLPAVMD